MLPHQHSTLRTVVLPTQSWIAKSTVVDVRGGVVVVVVETVGAWDGAGVGAAVGLAIGAAVGNSDTGSVGSVGSVGVALGATVG